VGIPFKDATLYINVLQIFAKDLSSDIAKLKKQLSLYFKLINY